MIILINYVALSLHLQDSRIIKFHMNMVIVLAGMALIGMQLVHIELGMIVHSVDELSHGLEHLKAAFVNAKNLHNAPNLPTLQGAKCLLELIT